MKIHLILIFIVCLNIVGCSINKRSQCANLKGQKFKYEKYIHKGEVGNFPNDTSSSTIFYPLILTFGFKRVTIGFDKFYVVGKYFVKEKNGNCILNIKVKNRVYEFYEDGSYERHKFGLALGSIIGSNHKISGDLIETRILNRRDLIKSVVFKRFNEMTDE